MKLIFNTLKFRQAVFTCSALIIMITLFPSCKKFLDTPQNSKQSLIVTVKDCQSILDNLNMYNQYPVDAQISSDDYYLTDDDYDAQPQTARELYIWLPTAQQLKNAGTDWLPAYSRINNTNIALESLADIVAKNNAIVDGSDFKLAKGMALFIRANNFYQLAVQYAAPYTPGTSNEGPGIPLRLVSDINAPSSRGTVQQTYDQIIQDLQEAVSLLPNTTVVPTRPSKAAAYALLGRIYLSMEEYTLAATAANASLLIKSDLLDYNADEVDKISDAPFKHFNKEVLYHSAMNAIDVYYAKVNQDVMDSYTDENDWRKTLFFRENADAAPGTYYFKGGYNEDIYSYFNGLAVDEVYLIRAECYARANNPAAAMADLNKLLRSRWKKDTYTDLPTGTKEAALSKILEERHKELIFRGQRWADLKRLNKTAATAVTLTRTVKGTVYNLLPNDLRYQLLLPQDVAEYGKLPQNPR